MTLKITAQADKKGKCGIVCSLRALSALFISLVSWANPIETVALLSEPVCLGLKRWLRLWGRRLLGVLEEIFPCVPQNGAEAKVSKIKNSEWPSFRRSSYVMAPALGLPCSTVHSIRYVTVRS